jgi:hypothetical protein
MKKAGNKGFADFPTAKLYLDDLLDIVHVLEESCGKVQIRTDGYDEIESSEIADFAASLDENRFSDIYIKAYEPFITFDLRSFGISAYISEDTLVQHGIVSKFREIIERRKKKYFGTLINILGLVPTAAFGISIAKGEWLFAVLFLGLSFLMIWPIVKYQMAHKVVVTTSLKRNESSFFSRKKDEILVAIGSALIGAIVSFALIKYFGQA